MPGGKEGLQDGHTPVTPEGGKDMSAAEERAKRFIVANTVPVDDAKVACVDGRYQKEEDPGAVSFPGGHLGLSEALVSLREELGLKSVGDCFSLVFEFVTKEKGQQFCWHSDKHADPLGEEDDVEAHEHHDGLFVGCGHCQKAIDYSDAYGVTRPEMLELLEIIRLRQEVDPQNMHMVNLSGNHSEGLVLRNIGEAKTVRHWDQDQSEMHFVYDKKLAEQLVAEFEQWLITKQGITIKQGTLQKVLDAQTLVTLRLLAAGKPVVDFNADADEVDVTEVMVVPSFE